MSSANSKYGSYDDISTKMETMMIFIFSSVLATAVNKLEEVNLADTFITDEQLIHILQQVLSPLKYLSLKYLSLEQLSLKQLSLKYLSLEQLSLK